MLGRGGRFSRFGPGRRPATLDSFVVASVFQVPQSLKRILEEKLNIAPYYYSEEMATDGNKSEIIGRAPEKHPPEYWEPDKQSILAHLFKDLMRTSKRSSSRYKKGGLRSCFGVRLERIGSFSGLGC
ncbi:unnamed protein product [Pleuronectes platessa]|uniref:C-type natriuretic peptide n=1 Tax=Pleuronectes platessa TaxID=8262 RepID=A0A9N7YQC6_PLEPL|nr:unnamed protein product [Pleuronectes platessa]